ncbi:hypothetical protein MRB53_036574 [Persea americana]|nr:hypothetical protein MRB53_036767 [Persea americana]KAJ8614376.1 hypothetical protein MRB53_036574 [Persea americana]
MPWVRSRLQSRLHSFSGKPVIEHSQTSRGKRVGDDVSKLSSKEPLLQEEVACKGSLVRPWVLLGCCYGSIESLPGFGSEIDAHPLAPVLAR